MARPRKTVLPPPADPLPASDPTVVGARLNAAEVFLWRLVAITQAEELALLKHDVQTWFTQGGRDAYTNDL